MRHIQLCLLKRRPISWYTRSLSGTSTAGNKMALTMTIFFSSLKKYQFWLEINPTQFQQQAHTPHPPQQFAHSDTDS